MREMGIAYGILDGKCRGKSPLGRSRHRWENNINVNLEETGREDVRMNSCGSG
jgi:hypothetical protein